jgi:hypothetical protein
VLRDKQAHTETALLFRNTKDADQAKMINLYRLACAAYIVPTLLTAVMTMIPGLARKMESSDNVLMTAIWWWAKVKYPSAHF